MGSTTLVEPMMEEGQEFLSFLHQHLPVFAAFWYWDAEAERWRLVVGSKYVDQRGPTEAYRQARDAMRQWGEHPWVPLEDLVLVGGDDPRLDILKDIPRTGIDGIGAPLRVRGAMLGGRLVEDAYIYKNALARTARRSGTRAF